MVQYPLGQVFVSSPAEWRAWNETDKEHLKKNRFWERQCNIAGVGAHQSICKLLCKEMVNTIGQDLQIEVESMAGAVIQGILPQIA